MSYILNYQNFVKVLNDVIHLKKYSTCINIIIIRNILPDNVARIDLYCPGAPQIVVIWEWIPRREDTPCWLALETATTLRYMYIHIGIQKT